MIPRSLARRAPPLAVCLALAAALCTHSGLAAADPPKLPAFADDDQELKSNSPEMAVGGIFLGLGSTAAIVGGLTYATNTTPGQPVSSSARTVGLAVAGVGVVGLAGGLALIVVGAKKVPAHEAQAAVPTVALGVTSATLTWSF
jgi:hypothetical protein